MKAILTLVVALLTASWAFAQQEAAPPAAKPSPRELQVQMHRTLADLFEARSAAEPDQARVDQLTAQVQTIRQQLWAAPPAAGGAAWGGPGRGYGRGPGYGYGRGPGYGYGRGGGPAWGGGRGMGRGPAWGLPGQGFGRGYGPGYGYGRGPGRGMGWGFVDANGDGICDNAQPPAAPVK
ncbi:MAG: hypothetical protein JW809_18270 [Pirellulales bacterium]|nr:hypothetical protein [Pirellulales bacterium]